MGAINGILMGVYAVVCVDAQAGLRLCCLRTPEDFLTSRPI